ncbi:MAG TPA: class I SAM-dependent methyltransferase [Gemmataceae bacterium]|nr:class I SAM-dependent methyltransferase [Gemmataceae bacterium]
MKQIVKAMAKQVPYLGNVLRERDRLRAEHALLWVPPGHFYSPILDAADRARFERDRARPLPREVPGVDLNEDGQLALLRQLRPYYDELPFADHAQPGLRYRYDNPTYSYSDAVCLYAMLRHLRPRRIIEVGSGWSSAVMLDTNERFLANSVRLTCVEPYPDVLHSVMTDADRGRVEVVPCGLQEVGPERFAELAAGDVLFIDSTHVCKPGSDVAYLFAEVLPRLAAGVHVHFHDIFYPFDYPPVWVAQGRAWNEAYMLRSFLQFNDRFRVVLFNTFLAHFHREWLEREMPLCRLSCGSLWLRRV